MSNLDLREPFQGYAYSYPHKSAYRTLDPPRPLREVWAEEDRTALQLYLHIPFCEMRCGYCNLFTRPVPPEDQVKRYLDTLNRQMTQVSQALAPFRIARLTLGGGTPTFLARTELERLFSEVQTHFQVTPAAVPTSVETSPATATRDRLTLLRELGVERVSMGIQSLHQAELRALSRPEDAGENLAAAERLVASGIPVVNLDLIYGIPGQTPESLLATLDQVLALAPQEVYLYPLYVRPLTGLQRRAARPTDSRTALYRSGRDRLLEAGYRQISMRFFQRPGARPPPLCAAFQVAPEPLREYRCQEDGMVGLGCGARSYTRRLHYSSDYAVSHRGVRSVLEEWTERSDHQLSVVDYGCEITPDEARRRVVIQSLLRCHGLDLAAYRTRFQTSAWEDLPKLGRLVEDGLASEKDGALVLTSEGLELSDALGPALYSQAVRDSMEGFEFR